MVQGRDQEKDVSRNCGGKILYCDFMATAPIRLIAAN